MAHQSSPNLFSPGPSRSAFSNLPMHMLAGAQRPIHLMRSPSFQPPPFDAEEPPPPIITPPPLYDNVIGTPSYDGLADYFARLGEYEGEVVEVDNTNNPANHNCGNVPNSYTNSGRHVSIMDLSQDYIFGMTGTNSIMAGSNSRTSTP